MGRGGHVGELQPPQNHGRSTCTAPAAATGSDSRTHRGSMLARSLIREQNIKYHHCDECRSGEFLSSSGNCKRPTARSRRQTPGPHCHGPAAAPSESDQGVRWTIARNQ